MYYGFREDMLSDATLMQERLRKVHKKAPVGLQLISVHLYSALILVKKIYRFQIGYTNISARSQLLCAHLCYNNIVLSCDL